MKNKMKPEQKDLLRKINNGIIFKFFSLVKLPMVFLSGLKIDDLTNKNCQTSVCYNFLNKNPFNSTYFAVLSMAAELSTGALVLLLVGGLGSDLKFIITGLNAKFHKKAKGKTIFKCSDSKKIFDAIVKARNGSDAVNQIVESLGYNEEGDLVASFQFIWTFKHK